jgi:lipopolysaccharide transport system permease protein
MTSTTLSRGGAQVWRWRGFIFASVARELRSRYARSLLGWVWLLLPPLVLIGIYTLVFSRLMRSTGFANPSPYAYSIFLCAGLLTWQWFSELLNRVVGLFTNYASLVKKTPVPWSALLAVDILVSVFGLAVQLALFALLMLALGQWPGWRAVAFIPVVFAQGLLAVGLGLGLAVFQVFFRDFAMMVPLGLQVWFWMTPIVYPMVALPLELQGLLQWNIMTPIAQAYQAIALSPVAPVEWARVAAVGAFGAAALLLSVRLMRRNSAQIRDEL